MQKNPAVRWRVSEFMIESIMELIVIQSSWEFILFNLFNRRPQGSLMPRLSHSELLRAYSVSPLLPLVLRGSRCLPSATSEFRWLKEHVKETSKPHSNAISRRQSLLWLCRRRARAEPLQYILGSQPFGELDIICRPGVLIPRYFHEKFGSHDSYWYFQAWDWSIYGVSC